MCLQALFYACGPTWELLQQLVLVSSVPTALCGSYRCLWVPRGIPPTPPPVPTLFPLRACGPPCHASSDALLAVGVHPAGSSELCTLYIPIARPSASRFFIVLAHRGRRTPHIYPASKAPLSSSVLRSIRVVSSANCLLDRLEIVLFEVHYSTLATRASLGRRSRRLFCWTVRSFTGGARKVRTLPARFCL